MSPKKITIPETKLIIRFIIYHHILIYLGLDPLIIFLSKIDSIVCSHYRVDKTIILSLK